MNVLKIATLIYVIQHKYTQNSFYAYQFNTNLTIGTLAIAMRKYYNKLADSPLGHTVGQCDLANVKICLSRLLFDTCSLIPSTSGADHTSLMSNDA